jgi:hypothetical protein
MGSREKALSDALWAEVALLVAQGGGETHIALDAERDVRIVVEPNPSLVCPWEITVNAVSKERQ